MNKYIFEKDVTLHERRTLRFSLKLILELRVFEKHGETRGQLCKILEFVGMGNSYEILGAACMLIVFPFYFLPGLHFFPSLNFLSKLHWKFYPPDRNSRGPSNRTTFQTFKSSFEFPSRGLCGHSTRDRFIAVYAGQNLLFSKKNFFTFKKEKGRDLAAFNLFLLVRVFFYSIWLWGRKKKAPLKNDEHF